jgi:hypothetical protein
MRNLPMDALETEEENLPPVDPNVSTEPSAEKTA